MTVNDAGSVSVFCSQHDSSGTTLPHREIPKPTGSGGSTVARPKLKGIDGMTPQSVEDAA